MSTKRQRFETNGTSALKENSGAFDVFVKPEFSKTNEATPIISFKEAKDEPSFVSSDEYFDYIRNSEPSRSLRGTALNLLKNNKILGSLFTKEKVENHYSREDVLIFAKGFSVTGVTALFLILFGV